MKNLIYKGQIFDYSGSSVFYFCTIKINRTQQYRISNTNGHRKGKKQQNDQRCNVLARIKLEDEGISSRDVADTQIMSASCAATAIC